MNLTLLDTVRSMLANVKLPQKFWAEAATTTSLSPFFLDHKTLVEAWSGDKPDVSV